MRSIFQYKEKNIRRCEDSVRSRRKEKKGETHWLGFRFLDKHRGRHRALRTCHRLSMLFKLRQ